MSGNIRLFSILVLIALLAVFLVQNTAVVEIRLLFWVLAMSRALMIVLVLLIGIAIGWLLRGHFSNRHSSS